MQNNKKRSDTIAWVVIYTLLGLMVISAVVLVIGVVGLANSISHGSLSSLWTNIMIGGIFGLLVFVAFFKFLD